MTKELLTPAEFEATYNISHTTLYREINAGRIRIIKIGRATRITRQDAEAWLAKKVAEAKAAATNDNIETDGTNPPSATHRPNQN